MIVKIIEHNIHDANTNHFPLFLSRETAAATFLLISSSQGVGPGPLSLCSLLR
jgi:hypothetical protein